MLENTPSLHTTCEDNFLGRLLIYNSAYILGYSSTGLYLFDYRLVKLVSYHNNVGPIVDVCVNGEEILVLRRNFTHRPLLRLLPRPAGLPAINIPSCMSFNTTIRLYNIYSIEMTDESVGGGFSPQISQKYSIKPSAGV